MGGSHYDIFFLGAGSMAEALIRGITGSGLLPPERVTAANRSNAERLRELSAKYGIRAAFSEEEKIEALARAEVVVLGMKPKDAAEAIVSLRPHLAPRQLVVSVIAGLSTGVIQNLLGRRQPVARTMPNTSSQIGLGAAGIAFSPEVGGEDRERVLALFRAVGLAAVVEEELLDAVTAVSGSGPAYIYYMMEAMMEAAGRLGLSPDAARELVVQTVRGAAETVRLTGEEPAELRRRVTSPGGTTQAAIETLERMGFREAVIRAMERAAERAGELGAAIAAEAEGRS
ncbi:MAG: pyrroline-5-carboxylate reductase [Paenibacillaceae bacterium ZCTH02-B3]|nr:MAG: pyrroline-5-carboxylate reductase [Paenibacillaceae bacterium ZCTH02-B3]